MMVGTRVIGSVTEDTLTLVVKTPLLQQLQILVDEGGFLLWNYCGVFGLVPLEVVTNAVTQAKDYEREGLARRTSTERPCIRWSQTIPVPAAVAALLLQPPKKGP